MTPNDPILDQAKLHLAQQEARARALNKQAAESRGARVRSDMNALHRFFIQVGVGLSWVWQRIASPLARLTGRFGQGVFRQYRRLWAYSVYRRNEFGTLILSKTRAGLFITGTVLTLAFCVLIAGFVFDAVTYAATARRDEVIFLTESQEVDPQGNIHAVRGCERLPCSDVDSLYFRVNPSTFNHAWALFERGGLFFPDYVAAAVPPGTNRCTVTSYGVRLKFLMRGADIYPEILEATCEPVKDTP